MNTSTLRSVFFVGLLTTALPCVLRAQFFKELVNTVKQTAQNRANDKASSGTNKALNKVDSATQIKSSGNSGSQGLSSSSGSNDATANNGILGAFAKAAAANPNDTSGADLTMKALGIMTGRGGVSAADSATAIKSFLSGSGGNGFTYQYLTSMSSKKSANPTRDTSTLFFTNSGNARYEMSMSFPGAGSTGKMITLAHAGQPIYSLTLYPDSKSYSLNVIDTALINLNLQSYKVTRIGNETVQGFACVHVKMVSTTGSGMFKSESSMDVWTSSGLPGYALFKKMENAQNVKPGMMQALENAGCGGLIVKMEMPGKDISMSMQIIRTEEKSFPDSYFKIPSGYTKSDENMMYHMMSGAMKNQPKQSNK